MQSDNICVNCGSQIVMMCRKDASRFCCELCEKGLKRDASEEDRTATATRLSETLRLTSPERDVVDRYNDVIYPISIAPITSENHREFILEQVRQRLGEPVIQAS